MAHADLLVAPTRVVIEPNQRAAQVELINRGSTTGTYRISVVNRRMGSAGGFTDVDMTEPPLTGERFADRMIRFSPRQVTLEPGESQTVRLMVRKPADLEAGEYRSHLLFSRQPDPTTETPSGAPGTSRQLSISITTLLSISIPVIVRHGQTDASASISDIAVQANENGDALLSVQLHREGNRSLYGDLVVYHTAPGRNEQVIGRIAGMSVYVPNAQRQVNVGLSLSAEQLSGGMLRVTYSLPQAEGGRLLAEAAATLR
ncbi:hypothetical protein NFC81_12520 [Salinispirillum sp. LH 10-3-1]|uniref:Molecular chaperone n=1 Tax=Salinispirillum sp. LH 10-3-1 TaxID=2952525 RepID=A0AB38YE03_9GAMM